MSTLPKPHWSVQNKGVSLNKSMAWIGVLLMALLVAIGLARWSGLDPRTPDAPAQWQLALQFKDLPNGDIAALDHISGRQVAHFSGEHGFLRSSLRALVRARLHEKLGPEAPFLLIGRTDGRLTLIDPSTQQRIDLESFGPSNAAVFAGLRLAGSETSPR